MDSPLRSHVLIGMYVSMQDKNGAIAKESVLYSLEFENF